MSFKFYTIDGKYVSEPVDEPYYGSSSCESHLVEPGTTYSFLKNFTAISEPEQFIPVRVC